MTYHGFTRTVCGGLGYLVTGPVRIVLALFFGSQPR